MSTPAPKTRAQLAAEYADKQAAVKALQDKGLDNLTIDETAQMEALLDERDAVKAELDRFPKAEAVKSRVDAGHRFLAEPVNAPHYPTKADADARKADLDAEDRAVKAGASIETGESETDKFLRRGPFKSFGHLCLVVQQQGNGKAPGFVRDGILGEYNAGIRKYDNAVKAMPEDVKAASGLNELADAEGSLLIPPDFAAGIWQRSYGEDSLLQKIGPTPVVGNGLKIKAWQDKSRTGDVLFGGAQAYWGSEASQMTKSNPSLRDIDLRLNKLYVLMYATEELLADAPALESELTRIAGACFTYKINKSLVRGGGVGEPEGLLNAGAKITQAAVSGQGAKTITATNIDNMFSRRAPGSAGNVIWLYNVDVEQQINGLNYSTGTNSGALVNMPPTGLAGMPNDSLKGRPRVEIEHCATLGTEGDLILWDPTSHIAIVKSTGINQAVSMHLRFDYDEVAFKFTFRMDARSRWEAPLTPAQSSSTRSPIVTLNSSRT